MRPAARDRASTPPGGGARRPADPAQLTLPCVLCWLCAVLACGGPDASGPASEGAPGADTAAQNRGLTLDPGERAPDPASAWGLPPGTPRAQELGWPLSLVDVAPGGRGARLELLPSPDALVLSVAAGTVTAVGVDPELGLTVTVEHGPQLVARYGGLDEVLVLEGLRVARGSAVGVPRPPSGGRPSPVTLELRIEGALVDPLRMIGHPPHDYPSLRRGDAMAPSSP